LVYKKANIKKAFELLLSASPSAFAIIDKQYRFREVNQEFASTISHKSVNEHILKSVEDVLGKRHWAQLGPIIEDVFRTGKVKEIEYAGKNAIFTEIYYPLIIDGEIVGVIMSVNDITIAKKKEAELDREITMTRKVMDSLYTFVGLISTDGILLEANKAAIDAANLNPEDVINKPFHEAYWWTYSKQSQDEILEYVNRARNGEIVREDIKARIGEDSFIIIDFFLVPSYDKNGELEYIIPSAIDITDRLRTQEELTQQKEEFKKLSETIPQLVWVTDKEGKVTFLGKRWIEYTGISELGDAWIHAIHPNDRVKTWRVWSKALEGKESYQVEYRIKEAATGEYRWFLGMGVPVINSRGNVTKWFGTCTDIHNKRMTEEALRASELRFKALSDANIVGIIILDLESTRIVESNLKFSDMLGYSKNEFKNKRILWDNLTPEEAFQLKEKKFIELREYRELDTFETKLVHKAGHKISVLIGGSMLYKKSDMCILFVLDISERIKMERRREEFLGMASHELKTPLTTIKGYTQMVEDKVKDINDEKLNEYLKRTNKYIDKLTDLINDLLDIARIQAGRMTFNKTVFDIYDLIKDCVETVQAGTQTHTVKIENNKHIKINGDRLRIEQVLINLLNNAIKYSPEAEKVIIIVEKQENNIILSVKDFGIGIPEDQKEKVFERFYRTESAEKNFSGLGVGLYISREIIFRHMGDMWVTSEVGKGSTFHFKLPIAE
jgi:PAS domain S-box-containing protein